MATRVTISIPSDLHAYLKERSTATGQTMGRVLSDLLRTGLMATPEGRAQLARAQQRLIVTSTDKACFTGNGATDAHDHQPAR